MMLSTAVIAAVVFLHPQGEARSAVSALPPTIKPGLAVSIVDDGGRKIEGRVLSISGARLRVSVRGQAEELSAHRLVRIEQPDRVWNGALVGAGIGAGLGVAGTVAYGSGDVALALRLIVGNGLMWGALGALVDAVRDNPRTLYERGSGSGVRLVPVIGARRVAAGLTIAW